MPNEISIPEDQYLTEAEMADALDISVETLRGACDPLIAKRIDPDLITYTFTHVHEGQFYFRRAVFEENLLKQAAYRDLKESGEWTNPEACNRWLGFHIRAGIISVPVTEAMINHLRTFVAAWERFDIGYSPLIAVHRRRISDLRDIWMASKYLRSAPHVANHDSIILVGDRHGPAGKRIPFQWLRYDADRGLFDRRDHTDDGKFIPDGLSFSDVAEVHAGDYVLLDNSTPALVIYINNDDPSEDVIAYTADGETIRYTEKQHISAHAKR